MLDYDGTLAPFHADRLQATPYAGVEDRLATLSKLERVRLVLVSGRSARELRSMLDAHVRAEIWGSHGREWLGHDGSYHLFALRPGQQNALSEVCREFHALGLGQSLEVKPTSLAIHWRNADQATQEQIRAAVRSAFARLDESDGINLLPFDGGVELRSTERTKGTAVTEILRETSYETPVAYLGDDLTDEDAFATLRNRGISILVRTEVRESYAEFWLRPPEELLLFLDTWIAGASQ